MQTLETTSKSNPGEVKAQKPSTRRTKVGKACDSCRRRKIKCNGLKPCPSCTIYGCECTYTDAKSTKISNQMMQVNQNQQGEYQRIKKLLESTKILGNQSSSMSLLMLIFMLVPGSPPRIY